MACQQKTAVWVEQGSTVSQLVLRFGEKHGRPGGAQIGVVRVYGCDGASSGPGAFWAVGPHGGTADFTRLVYGETPPGFVSDEGPLPLTPGCYKVAISGTGTTEFEIDPDGKVTEKRDER